MGTKIIFCNCELEESDSKFELVSTLTKDKKEKKSINKKRIIDNFLTPRESKLESQLLKYTANARTDNSYDGEQNKKIM